ncbi:MAG: site-2 protease family protein [Anaerolineales bacterium]|nr:site-2 protease family protein [Anaerolineales bacterium]MCB9127631.1 site-2 protease family protein [Ardenticatenales bacterium]
MFILQNLNLLAGFVIAFVVGITFHEFAHAATADALGDDLPRSQGRLTLNPVAHMTLWGTLLLFMVGFGWGRPVQHRIWEPRKRLWVALAGPVANLLIALVLGLLVRFDLVPAIGPDWFYLPQVVVSIIYINVLLAVFNLIPLSPLDGSAVLAGLLPGDAGRRLAQYNAAYPQALIALLLIDFMISYSTGSGFLWRLLGPPIDFLMRLFTGG